MTLEDLYLWLADRFEEPQQMRMGSVDGQAQRFLGVFDAAETASPARICLGGADCTHWDVFPAKLTLRWGTAQPEAEAAARRLWALFYGQTSLVMGSSLVMWADPGAGPRPLGKGNDGVFEYEVNVRLFYRK